MIGTWKGTEAAHSQRAAESYKPLYLC